MAGNKMSSKNKGKDDKSKTNMKSIGPSGEETDEPDFSLLRKPILTSITGFGQARKIFDLATEELKDLLSNECDLLYECKVCRNIFRSLANFISHKRVYCKEKFNTSLHGHFIKASSTISELMKIKNLEQGYQESLKEKNVIESKESNDIEDRIPLTKDLTAIVEQIAKNRGVYKVNSDEPQVSMQKIPHSSVAVFQNIEVNEDQTDNMRAQVKELHNILSRDIAVLERDGKFKIKSSGANASDSVIQISDDEENSETGVLKCKICDTQFSTQKTLKFHMKYKHVESRLVYPCPDCLEIFSTSWSVYRHLFKVHRKTAAQIRRLRESIQAKAFKMNNPPAFYEKRKNNLKPAPAQKITEEERLDQENQAWMDNMEGDGEVPRCGGCGRAFERRAALAAHTHTCQPRSRALARRPPETKRIEIQIRKDYNKGPPPHLQMPISAHDAHENKLAKEEPAVSIKRDEEEEKSSGDDDKDEATAMDVSEDDQKSNGAADSPEKVEDIKTPVVVPKPIIRLPFAHQSEKSNFVTFRQKIKSEIEINKLLCKRCDIQCGDVQALYDHVADHLKWMRYACKLCNFKHYSFEKLPEHVKVVHKLKGDKDFYFSTVKAIAGPEALELCESTEECNDTNETSPDSRRPSRCSSDSSRLSDDSSSSSTRIEGSRKRKSYQSKSTTKRRREEGAKAVEENKDNEVIPDKCATLNLEENDSSLSKTFEENSSDMDDVDEKNSKKQILVEDTSSVASRRPVRRKAKPKNEDFEYDLSNLLKMEAQGYRDSQSLSNQSKSNQTKRKTPQENQNSYDIMNKDSSGALATLSKKAVENSAAHMKTSFSKYCIQKELKPQNIFVRPLVPKNVLRGDKTSPKKECNEDRKECSSSNKDSKAIIKSPAEDCLKNDDIKPSNKELNDGIVLNKQQSSTAGTTSETIKTNINNIPAVLPLKFRRQSLEVIKNPIINKNISEFTKAGMKTKILVIKPINRNKDGKQAIKTPLKFQTIKLKDPNKISSSNEDKSDQVVVVKVPNVECANSRLTNDACTSVTEKQSIPDKQSDSNLPKTLEIKDDQHDTVVNKEVVNESNCIEDNKSVGNDCKPEGINTEQSESSSFSGECANKDGKSVVTVSEPLKNVNSTL